MRIRNRREELREEESAGHVIDGTKNGHRGLWNQSEERLGGVRVIIISRSLRSIQKRLLASEPRRDRKVSFELAVQGSTDTDYSARYVPANFE